MSLWYYAVDREQRGPVRESVIRDLLGSGEITESTLVFTKGMNNWQRIADVPDFNQAPAEVSSQQQYAFGEFPKSDSAPQPAETTQLNPYATPSASLVTAPETGPGEEIEPGSQPLDPGACMSRAFTLTKRHFGTLFVTGVVSIIVFAILGFFMGMLSYAINGPVSTTAPVILPDGSVSFVDSQVIHSSPITDIITQIISTFLGLGFTAIGLNIVRGKDANVAQLFSQGHRLISALVSTVLYLLIVLAGLLLFIVPGIYLGLRLSMHQVAIVDKGLGPTEALKYSWRRTEKNTGRLFALYLLGFLVNLAGLIALLIGVIFTIPLTWLSLMVAYVHLQHGHAAAMQDKEDLTRF